MRFSLPKCLSRPFQAQEGVGFGPLSYLRAYVSRVDNSRVENRRGCIFSRTIFDFVETHPRLLSDVTHSAFCPRTLCDVYMLISLISFFGVPKRVKRLVQLNFKPKVLFGYPGGYSLPIFFPLRASLDLLKLLLKVWVLPSPASPYMCLYR